MLKRFSPSIRKKANQADTRTSSRNSVLPQRRLADEEVVARPIVDNHVQSHNKNNSSNGHRHTDEASIDENSLFTTSRFLGDSGHERTSRSGRGAAGTSGLESSSASIFAPSDASQYNSKGLHNYDDVWSVNTGLGNEDEQQQQQSSHRKMNHRLKDTRQAPRQQSYDAEMESAFPFPTDNVYFNEFATVDQGGPDLDFSTLRTDDGIIQEAKGPATSSTAAAAYAATANGRSVESTRHGETPCHLSQPQGKVGVWYRTLPAWVRVSMWLILLLLVVCIVLSVTFTLVHDNNQANHSTNPASSDGTSIRPTSAPSPVVAPPTTAPVSLSTDAPTMCSDTSFKFVIQSKLWDCATLSVQSDYAFVVQACQLNVSQAYFLCPATCGLCN